MLPEIILFTSVALALASLPWSIETFRKSASLRWLRLLCLVLIGIGFAGLATRTMLDQGLTLAGFERGRRFAVCMFSLMSLGLGIIACGAGVIIDALRR